ncbi:type II secretion system F family protein [bacterium]|nr:type II secretion system F family protein [bacterium]
MALFEYKGIKKDSGKKTVDFIWAKNSEDARQKLTYQLMIDITVKEVPEKRIKRKLGLQAVKRRDMISFLKKFSDLLKRGIMPDTALDIINTSVENKTIELAIYQMVIEIKGNGENFPTAFKAATEMFFPEIVPENCLTIIEAGNKAGPEGLLKALKASVTLLEKSDMLNRKIMAALTYPIFLIITSVSIVIYLFSFTIPRIIEIFGDLTSKELPILTRALLVFSGFMEKYWFILIIIFAVICIIYQILSRHIKFGLKIDRLKISIPYLGTIIRKRAIANFSSTLSILLSGGLDIMHSLEGAAKVHENRLFKESIQDIILNVRQGETLAGSISKHRDIFYPDVASLIHVGEKIAELPSMLEHISVTYEEEIDYRISYLTTLLEPVIILVMGLIVGITIIAILTPLFELSGIG